MASATLLLVAALLADSMPQPLTNTAGDAGRGHAIVANREQGLCVLCHAGPFGDPHFPGTIGPDLTGVADRLSAAQLRQRVANERQVNPDSIMPPYRGTAGRQRVAGPYQGKPILSDQQIEDVVAYLSTLHGR